MYIGGGTNSVNFPTTNGVLMPAHKGGVDGYITKINQNGTSVLASTYYGSSAYDQVYLVKATETTTFMPLVKLGLLAQLSFKMQFGISRRGQFISKISPNLDEVVWSTAFGSSSNNSGQPIFRPQHLWLTCATIFICRGGVVRY